MASTSSLSTRRDLALHLDLALLGNNPEVDEAQSPASSSSLSNRGSGSGMFTPNMFDADLAPTIAPSNTTTALTEAKTSSAADASATPALPALGQIQQKIRRGVDWATVKLIEVGKDALQQRRDLGKSINLGPNMALGLRIEEQIMLPEHERITKDAFKQLTAAQFKAKEQAHVWLESQGLVELSGSIGAKGMLPIPYVPVNAGIGFSAKGVVVYRTMGPIPASIEKAPEAILETVFCLPMQEDSALQMPCGAEVELIGQGNARLNGSLGLGLDYSSGGVGIGAELDVEMTGILTGLLGLRILRGPRQQIEVTLSRITSQSLETTIALQAGLDIETTFGDTPPWGEGCLQSAAEKIISATTSRDAMTWLADLTSVHAAISQQSSERQRGLVRYRFDLSHPMARQAYKELLRLDASRANALSDIEGSGIHATRLDDTTNITSSTGDITLLSHKVLLAKTLQMRQQGVFRNRHGQRFMILNGKAEKTFNHDLAEQTAIWESMHVRNEATDSRDNYCRFQFSKTDYVTYADEVKQFMQLAECLGIAAARDFDWTNPELGVIMGYFSDHDDTKMDIDLYLTAPGIAAIDATDKSRALQAYLQALRPFHADLRDMTFLADAGKTRTVVALLEEYQNRGCFARIFGSGASDIAVRYAAVTGGRLLDDDIDMFEPYVEQAQTFAQQVGALNITGQGQQGIMDFWQNFQSTGFDFMPTIVALFALAGRDKCLVHKLKLAGSGVTFKSKDEGALHCEVASQIESEFG